MKTDHHVYSLPLSASFTGVGVLAYAFGPLSTESLVISYLVVEGGHDIPVMGKQVNCLYYILSGQGYFKIGNHQYCVRPNMLVEIRPHVEHYYSGEMKVLAFSTAISFEQSNTLITPDVDIVRRKLPSATNAEVCLSRLLRLRILGKSPLNVYLRLNKRLWTSLPVSITALGPIRSFGYFLHFLVRSQSVRGQLPHTFFLRNRAMLELLRRIAEKRPQGDTLRVAVLGCSAGAEAYSVAWRIRSARPDLKLILQAVDISDQAVEVARGGVYSPGTSQITGTDLFDLMTEAEIEELFDRDGKVVTVKSWIKGGIKWHVGDVRDSEMIDALGPQDIVVANNFLCHMDAAMAERCLRNIARLVSRHGYLFVSGVDLDIRTKIAQELKWTPLQDLLEEIHCGDPRMGAGWPWNYSSLEPINKKRRDWRLRYAAVFQLSSSDKRAEDLEQRPSWQFAGT
jgi:chemotaxis methyl-accepting protein methylase